MFKTRLLGLSDILVAVLGAVGALDSVLDEVARVATALEAVTDYHVNDSDLACSDSIPITLRLPRSRRQWLSIDSKSDGG